MSDALWAAGGALLGSLIGGGTALGGQYLSQHLQGDREHKKAVAETDRARAYLYSLLNSSNSWLETVKKFKGASTPHVIDQYKKSIERAQAFVNDKELVCLFEPEEILAAQISVDFLQLSLNSNQTGFTQSTLDAAINSVTTVMRIMSAKSEAIRNLRTLKP